ncbi:MAG: CinA family protein [Campylobacterota bacterium]|nr:CinA family protein [Campylobacterota bacterium]
MKTHLIYIGRNFSYDRAFQDYSRDEIEERLGQISSMNFFNESDNSLFLFLEKILLERVNIVILTTKSTFSIIGKLLCTITSDNQVLKDGILLPSHTSLYEKDSYLLNYKDAVLNIIQTATAHKLPTILIKNVNRSATIHIFEEDIVSSKILLEPLSQTYDTILYYTTIIDGWIQVNIDGTKYGNINQFIASAKQLLPSKIVGASNIVAYINERLLQNNYKISFAESCTGGLLASKFTAISGVSSVFNGSLITYSNELKSNWLAVSEENIEKFGVVSGEIVDEMSDGVMNVSDSHYAISISGIAGPDGGSEYKPVGTVYVSVRGKKQHTNQLLELHGNRTYIQEQSTLHAIKMLLLFDKETFF